MKKEKVKGTKRQSRKFGNKKLGNKGIRGDCPGPTQG